MYFSEVFIEIHTKNLPIKQTIQAMMIEMYIEFKQK